MSASINTKSPYSIVMIQYLACYIYIYVYTYLPLKDFIGENAAKVEFGVIQSRHPAKLLRCLDFAGKGERTFLHNEAPFGEENIPPRILCRLVVRVLCWKKGCVFNNPQT